MMDELNNWKEEKRSAYLYGILAQVESGNSFGKLFSELAKEAEQQAAIWAEKIRKRGGALPEKYTPDLRARLVGRLVEILGTRMMRTILAAMKVRGMSVFSPPKVGHPVPLNLQDVGRRHKAAGTSGVLRAVVFGINDGLVSNASLILGIAGASSQNKFIVLSGIAGLLAGAFSMGAGEYVSMRSQREMFEHQIGLEKEELKEYPSEEAKELALIYQAKGLSAAESQELAEKLIADPEHALDTLAREELGLNPEQLGSPWGAAIFSFLSFTLGAMIPLGPYLLTQGSHALLTSIGLTAVALFIVGAVLSLFSGRKVLWGGLRMLLIGGAAGAATFFIGKLLGVSLS